MPTDQTTKRPGGMPAAQLPDMSQPAPPRYNRDIPPISAAAARDEPPEERTFPEEAPAPSAPAPAPAAPPTLAALHEKLCKPFSLVLVEVKPGATNGEKTRALALAYVDPRAYQARLDRLAGPEGWSVEYRALGERAMLCRLTILGVTREDVGESDPKEPNGWTSATMQAFKRACAAFGIGRYLYALPKPWVEYDGQRKLIKNPEGAARQIYELAGIQPMNGSKE